VHTIPWRHVPLLLIPLVAGISLYAWSKLGESGNQYWNHRTDQVISETRRSVDHGDVSEAERLVTEWEATLLKQGHLANSAGDASRAELCFRLAVNLREKSVARKDLAFAESLDLLAAHLSTLNRTQAERKSARGRCVPFTVDLLQHPVRPVWSVFMNRADSARTGDDLGFSTMSKDCGAMAADGTC
jgi:NADH:ubiquinone oxidoreductase subunit